MSKQILPNELAEIVAGLLIKPELLGELDSPERHQSFIEEIAQVVADHCGGYINGISPADCDDSQYLVDEYSAPYVSVSPDDCLGSLTRNVWAAFDVEGWEEEIAEAESEDADSVSDPMSTDEIKALRNELQQLLSVAAVKYSVGAEQAPAATVSALLAEQSQLQAALAPFAKVAERFQPTGRVLADKRMGEAILWSAADRAYEISAQHCLNAAAALSGCSQQSPAGINRVVVLVDGGMVQSAWANGSTDLTVIDRDNERAGDEETDLDEATEGLDPIY